MLQFTILVYIILVCKISARQHTDWSTNPITLEGSESDLDGARSMIYFHQIIDPTNNITLKLLEEFKNQKAELKIIDQEIRVHYQYVRVHCTSVLKKTFNRGCREAMNQIVVSIPQKKQEFVQKILNALDEYIKNVREKEEKQQIGWKGMHTKLREAAEKVYEYYNEFYDVTSDDIESGKIYRYAKCEMSFWKRITGKCFSYLPK